MYLSRFWPRRPPHPTTFPAFQMELCWPSRITGSNFGFVRWEKQCLIEVFPLEIVEIKVKVLKKKSYSKVIDRSTASLLMFFVIPCPTSHVSCINDFTEWNLEKLMALLSEKNGKTSKRIYINLKNSTCTFMHIYNTSSIKYTWVVYILSYFIKQQFSQTCLSSFSTDGGWNCLSHLF